MQASIVVPTRGGALRLPILFAALRAQVEKDFEVIVVLDGDIDSSRAVCEAEQAKGELNLRVIEFPENRGRVAALNAGFEAAIGDVYIRTDDDFEPYANYVSKHVELHLDGPRGVIGLAVNLYQETAYAEAYGREAEARFHAEAYETPSERRWLYWAGNVSIDAVTYQRIGPYDADYRAYGWEDVDWGRRLFEAGIPIVIDKNLATPHYLSAVTVETRARRAYQSGAARLTFEAKHPGALGEYHVPWNPWLVGVRAVAHLPPAVSIASAKVLDIALPKVPKSIGSRLVALVIEGCVLGGRWRADYNDLSI